MLGLHSRSWIPILTVMLIGASPAGAVVIDTVATSFTGDPIEVKLTFDDAGAGPGEVWIGMEIVPDFEGDLRGLFLNLADDSLLAGLAIDGPYVTSVVKGGVWDAGRGANLHGGGSPCPCDVGIQLGSPGRGKDDIASTYVILSHPDFELDLSMFRDQLVGVRVTSVGSGGDRNGSSKTIGLVPVPEPQTASLLSLGLIAMASLLRRRGAGAGTGSLARLSRAERSRADRVVPERSARVAAQLRALRRR
jgi:hypothetical protein